MAEQPLQKVEVKTEEGESLLRKMPSPTRTFNFKGTAVPAFVIIAIILAGVVSGYFLANRGITPVKEKMTELTGGVTVVQGPKEVGIKDEEVFRDTAQGRIKVNDSDIIEGSHILIRPGGESQTAYLTSSVLDLNQFLGKCVQVWGETFAGQQAGWLMDVGRVKVLDSCPEGV